MHLSKFDRQTRIKGWDQAKLSDAKVLIAGAGALGNELIKNLALMGIGAMVIIDFDHIEESNLSRTVLFRGSDIGASKATVAAARAKELYKDIQVFGIHGDLFFDIGLGYFHWADIVISGLDNLAARSKVGEAAFKVGKPFLDGGIWELGGEIRWFVPGKSQCYDCTLNGSDWQRAHLRKSCTGFRMEEEASGPAPTAIGATSIIGGLMAQETVRYLCEMPMGQEPGEATVFDGRDLSMHQTILPEEDDCACTLKKGAIAPIISVPTTTSITTAADLFAIAIPKLGTPCILELGRDWLLGFEQLSCKEEICPLPQTFEPINQHKATVAEAQQVCPKCKRLRETKTVARLSHEDPLAELTLAELGVPPGEILRLHSPKGEIYLMLEGDIANSLK